MKGQNINQIKILLLRLKNMMQNLLKIQYRKDKLTAGAEVNVSANTADFTTVNINVDTKANLQKASSNSVKI